MSTGRIYSIKTTPQRDNLGIEHIAMATLSSDYSNLSVILVCGEQYLIGYHKVSGGTDTYQLSAKAPYLTQVKNTLDLGEGWDIIEVFYVANKPYLMGYQSENGHMYFYPVTDSLATEQPLHFYHTRYPYTTDLTEVKPLVSQGQVFVLGYNHTNGYVNIWTVSATSTSAHGQPPLKIDIAWAHQWAKGWTRFAFFTWGNENFFLKTNDWKPNVNIDHIWNDLSKGTNEVGSRLKLKDDQELNIVHPFYVGAGNPYFLTYLAKTGESTFNRIHGDCLGWTTCATENCPTDIQQIVPYRIGEINYALYI